MIVKILKSIRKKGQEDIEQMRLMMKNPELTEIERRSLAAKINGIHRRYNRDVLVKITLWALQNDGSSASKYKVEKWQEESFGRSVSNNFLTAWCKSDRGCGERVEFGISEDTTKVAQELFAIFENTLKVDIDARRLKAVSGQLLDEALGI